MTVSGPLTLCGAVLFVLSTAAHALPGTSFERAEMFATCSGRLEALTTRQRGRSDENAEHTARLHAQFEMLLDAVRASALSEGVPATQPEKWRIRGWTEIAYLLWDVDYSFDRRRAERAAEMLRRKIADCSDVLL